LRAIVKSSETLAIRSSIRCNKKKSKANLKVDAPRVDLIDFEVVND